MESDMLENWRAKEEDVGAIAAARQMDPFAVLGPHLTVDGWAIRAFVTDALSVRAITREGAPIVQLGRRKGDFFEGLIPGATERPVYRLEVTRAEGVDSYEDSYAFGSVLGPLDDHLLVEGSHKQLYRRLGAQLARHEGADGVVFAVWAPNASRVSVVGDFNQWDGRKCQMRKRIDSGLWEIFIPHLSAGAVYKYEIVSADGVVQPLKADPFGFEAEMRPSTASIVARTSEFSWTDAVYRQSCNRGEARRLPISIFEVHLGSWRRGDDNRFLSYDELADQLIPYAADLGFTHLELLPISEHPLDESWGYQPVGLFAPTRRHGEPEAFARFVDRAHAAGLGVILDWVPAHFPTDAHGLARFDGGPLYENADPRKGYAPDWGTAIYDFGRKEVANFLYASALYWIDRFHVDGLRVDAVASMLYLDYSRKPGEWLPNADGGNENRDAIAFLKRSNELIYGLFPGAMTIAEESTAFAGVSSPTNLGGLGFGFKWNMGWMHDTLEYMSRDPIYRRWSHDKMTFGLLYAFAENFILSTAKDRWSAGCRATNGSASPTRAPITASCGAIPARSCCSWARNSARPTNGIATRPCPGGCSTSGRTRGSRRWCATSTVSIAKRRRSTRVTANRKVSGGSSSTTKCSRCWRSCAWATKTIPLSRSSATSPPKCARTIASDCRIPDVGAKRSILTRRSTAAPTSAIWAPATPRRVRCTAFPHRPR
jgi:1,4-alpha-glucan branching enzyme